ncbi:MAG: hypothetical protein HXS48_25080, partial [Theionarchaea archaeon]|nr:hypothetical protein [Theionarchaea archaeon]
MKRTHIIFVIMILLFSGCASQTQRRKESVEESVEELPKEPVFPDTRWTYQDLPDLTNEQRIELALNAQREGDAYYERMSNKAEELSESLERYIYQWLAGEV